jgi:sugar lactone lactonase YvrE
MAAPHVERLTVSEPYLRLGSILAEGPFYRPEDDTLHFVDIKAKLLHCVPLSGSGEAKVLQIDDMLGVACLIENDDKNYIVAAKRGFGLVNQSTGQLTYIAKVFDNEDDELRCLRKFTKLNSNRLRFNDGAIDCMGRFWAGAMFEYLQSDLF